MGDDFSGLPEPESLSRLARRAATFYGAPGPANVVAAPGSQILMSLIADLSAKDHAGKNHTGKTRAAILGPTYAEHARIAALAGHEVTTRTELAALGAAELAIVVNPNNPDGRILAKEELSAVAARQKDHGGLLVVDEAFMDVGPSEASLGSLVEQENIVVLRSFGKFFGLSGLRLSFALSGEGLAAPMRARLGPWPVSGPSLRIGALALEDETWIAKTRAALKADALRLEELLRKAGLECVGCTDLFTLVQSPVAPAIFNQLGEAGILVRRFDENPNWLRFGIPGAAQTWQRLTDALRALS